jgi:hypothetical protein
VQAGHITLEQMCDWIASIEPADEPQHTGETLDHLTASVIRAEQRAYEHEPCSDSETGAELGAAMGQGWRG